MEHKDQKLNLDLDFLGEGVPEKSEKKHEKKDQHKPEHKSATSVASMSDGAQWTIVAIGIAILLIVIAAASGGGSSNSETASNTLPQPKNTETTNTETLENAPEIGTETNSYIPVAEREETVSVVQTPLEICQERHGFNATYDSATNSCGCTIGYSMGATSQQCVSFTIARDQSCAAQWPGTSFLKVDPVDGKNICDCEVGSYWNNERTACYSLSSFNQSCVNTFGAGAYSTTENGKRVCDCGYGYAFNPQRNACVSVSSINVICERDVGRNSRYAGSSSEGKYNCTEPY